MFIFYRIGMIDAPIYVYSMCYNSGVLWDSFISPRNGSLPDMSDPVDFVVCLRWKWAVYELVWDIIRRLCIRVDVLELIGRKDGNQPFEGGGRRLDTHHTMRLDFPLVKTRSITMPSMPSHHSIASTAQVAYSGLAIGMLSVGEIFTVKTGGISDALRQAI